VASASKAPLCKDADMAKADLSKHPIDVAAMFDDVAERYDITNDVLALGQTRIWRKAVLAAVAPAPGERVLDLAAGTGTSSLPFAEAGAFVVPCDFSLGMLAVGRKRLPDLPFVAGDALHLPFADASFDAVTMSFGIRNVVDYQAGLVEMLRVMRPGGRLVICEFSHPVWSPFRTVYTEYLMKALPAVARAVASNPEAYEYLADSIRAWPRQQEFAAELQSAGWSSVQWRDLTGGIVAIHRATRPSDSRGA
jgi:demethylmenaquinone methyltransferase/2-methoxy-6-polyprenyl-1,4-benzoquinol methylase